MRIILVVILIHLSMFSLSQKSSITTGMSITKPANASLILPNSGALNKASFGSGFFINFDRSLRKSEVSSIIYGIEVSSLRFSFLMDGFSTYFQNTSLKLPLFYSFTHGLTKQFFVKMNLGVNTQIQTNRNLTTLVWNNSISFKRTTMSGIFPLLHLGLGFKYVTKQKRSMLLSLAYNHGFINNEEVIYSTINPVTETILNSNGSFFELRFALEIFKNGINFRQ